MSVALKKDFPIFNQTMNGKALTFLDSAASAQKPQAMIDAMTSVMTDHYANIHRGLYAFSQITTDQFEKARATVAQFIHAEDDEIIFTRNATESINLVASSWGGSTLTAGDEIVITAMEHHANIVPWQMIAEKTGAVIKVTPIDDHGDLIIEEFEALLSDQTKIVAFGHMSNALGTVHPVEHLIKTVRTKTDAKILIDGCQSVVHIPINVKKMDCDFFVFSGHKLYGPSGIGVLYAKKNLLDVMPPYQGGGDMIDVVDFNGTTFKSGPARFEAGTPAIVETIGLAKAIEYLSSKNWHDVLQKEDALFSHADTAMREIAGLKFYSNAQNRRSIITFNMNGVHASDVATLLDQQGVAVRAGHHCAMPLMKCLGTDATVRVSLGAYNDHNDIERLIEAVTKIQKMMN